jgi:hypothetical protein
MRFLTKLHMLILDAQFGIPRRSMLFARFSDDTGIAFATTKLSLLGHFNLFSRTATPPKTPLRIAAFSIGEILPQYGPFPPCSTRFNSFII